MRLVVDTNRIIAALIRDSMTRFILLNPALDFFTPDHTINEMEKHDSYIREKSGLTKEDIRNIFELIRYKIKVVPFYEYEDFIEEAKRIIGGIDINDVPFFACALSIRADGIWSDDEHFLKQDKIRIWKTEHLLKELRKDGFL